MFVDFIRRIANKIRHLKYKKIINKGKNNSIDIPIWRTEVFIYGNNNKVHIDESSKFTGGIYIGTPDCHTDNCTVYIGKNTTANGAYIRLMEDESQVKIGDDCMLSGNIEIACSDTHSIIDLDKNLLNVGKFINIGNRVWICRDARLCKNISISDNCVIGMGSIVTKSFSESNCIIAGLPARIVKRNIDWSRLRPKKYLELRQKEV